MGCRVSEAGLKLPALLLAKTLLLVAILAVVTPLISGCRTLPVGAEHLVPKRGMTVQSAPITGVNIAGTPSGTTNYFWQADDKSQVRLTAPATADEGATGYIFLRWVLNNIDQPEGQSTVTFNINQDTTVTAVYRAEMKPHVRLAMEGRKLSSEEAEQLEDMLNGHPWDLSSRIKLLGYYYRRRFRTDSARRARHKHVMWIIENSPDAEIAGRPQAHVDPVLDREVYYQARMLWLKQVETHPENTSIVGNASNFFLVHDNDTAENLLKRAQALEPDNPEWSMRLGHLYALSLIGRSGESRREAAATSLSEYEKALGCTSQERIRFYMLGALAKVALEAGELSKAQEYATELLDKAAHYANDWNYGNAIHDGNLILGRLALKSGDLERAKAYLIEAGKTPGSPQLNSFGPNMSLAKELLEKGEKEVVLEYFDLCAEFWKGKKDQLEKWANIVKEGEIPDFGPILEF